MIVPKECSVAFWAKYDEVLAAGETPRTAALNAAEALVLSIPDPPRAWMPHEVPQEVFKMVRDQLRPLLTFPNERVKNNAAIRVVIANVVHRFSGQSVITNIVSQRGKL